MVDGVKVFDSLGATLPSDEAARFYAEKLAKSFTRPEVKKIRAKTVRVTSETGEVVFRVPIWRHRRRA